jgi:hypothetical protein
MASAARDDSESFRSAAGDSQDGCAGGEYFSRTEFLHDNNAPFETFSQFTFNPHLIWLTSFRNAEALL